MRLIKFLVSIILMGVVFGLLNQRQGSIPPLGKFLDPFGGFWRNHENLGQLPDTLDVLGLRGPVSVIWDDRQVPHVFAESVHDLYFAQGYLTARHRLWQMEFQTHVAAGRVSEIIGDRAIEYDRLQRRRGMVLAAERALVEMRNNTETHTVMQAYADGVNAWIDNLRPGQFPIEYKLLDYVPEPWSTLKTALLLKYMAWDLTGRNSEIDLTHILQTHGSEFVNRYYPTVSPGTDPVIPRGKRWRFEALKRDVPEDFDPLNPKAFAGLWDPQPHPSNGSNNWAVAGKKTRSGYPILSNDPHLGLALPSIWYEIQLCDGEQNVYGVSLPGAPSVIVGFNENVSWGVTNAGSDVMDWYEVEFEDEAAIHYLRNGEWVPAELRVEEIAVRGNKTVSDTLRITHHGPVVHYGSVEDSSGQHILGLAMRWMAHDPSNELQAFLDLNHAENYDDFIAALSNYDCPAQNFAFASHSGDIAIQHNGKLPVRYEHQGKFVQDGRDTTHDWQAFIPHEQLPTIVNPFRGYVSSANQYPAGGRYPYYLGWGYETWERGARINSRLERMNNITPADMAELHMDNLNLHAQAVLPVLLANLDLKNPGTTADSVLAHVRAWNYHNQAELIAPWFFNRWWRKFESAIWADELTIADEVRKFPDRAVTGELLKRRRPAPEFDNINTDTLETLSGLVEASFQETVVDFTEQFGPFGEDWNLGKTRGTDLKHLLGLKGFGPAKLATSGGRKIVNATDLTHGPSWRMIVSMGPEIKAQGIYPGGQSGNPGSAYYDQMVNDWVAGNYHPLIFLPSPDEFPANHLGGATLMRNTQ